MITMAGQDDKPTFDDTGELPDDLRALRRRIDILSRHLPPGHGELVNMIDQLGTERPDVCRDLARRLELLEVAP